MGESRFEPLTDDQMRVAAAGVVALPIEQSGCWERFECSQGRRLWGRFQWMDEGRPVALIALYEYSLHGARYLWARHGPVWLKEQSPERASRLREDLRALVRQRDRGIVFVRLHAAYAAPDLAEPLQTITYDRTVVVDTSGGTEDSVLGSMTAEGRRAVRRARRRMEERGGRVVEETGLGRERFHEYYAVLIETAERDGFRPHPECVYWDLLETLGPDHARLFGVRVGEEGRLVCWDLVLVNDRRALAYYGASSLASRDVLGPDALDSAIAVTLAGEGIAGFDLMGAHSPRIPELYSVGRYKRRFAQRYTDIDGAWDMTVHAGLYRALLAAMRAKHGLTRAGGRILPRRR
ncbi:lipid II:glycine glycyltransferase FemX [Schaalia naturae]|jgi:hypothetical protein|uniref:Lipid II:glycine glycyltransferase FemX n=1 Tax=Schaalia naturae TaxID=635203 RepID=A0ABW2SKF0_9ACTO